MFHIIAAKLAAKAGQAAYDAYQGHNAAQVEALAEAYRLTEDYPARGTFEEFEAAVRIVKAEEARQRAEQERRDTEEAGRHDAERQKLAEAARESAAERRRLETELRTAHALIGRASHEHVDSLELKFAQALCDHHHVDPSKPYA